MVRLKEARFRYLGSGAEIFHGLNFSLMSGDRIVLTGGNGSGKSTLLHLIAGFLRPTSGEIEWSNMNLPIRFGLVQQQPENQIIANTVEEEIAFGLENLGLPQKKIRDQVDRTLEQFGLTQLRMRPPGRLSGGEMQRVVFACAYALNPSLWLLDEPLTFLDPFERKRLMALLELIPQEKAILWATTEPEEYPFKHRLVALEEGELVEKTDKIDKTNKTNETNKTNKTNETNKINNTNKIRMKVEVEGISVCRKELFGNQREILHDLDFTLPGGEITVLLGENASGKTTLIEALAGLIPLTKGEVSWGDKSPDKLKGQIGVAFQFPERSFFSETVLDEIMYGSLNLRRTKEESRQNALQALKLMGLDPEIYFNRSPYELSGGEARRVALAAVWALQPLGYLLDEPTAGLDEMSCQYLKRMLKLESERGCVILVAGHDTRHLLDWADRWMLLKNGRIEIQGGSETAQSELRRLQWI